MRVIIEFVQTLFSKSLMEIYEKVYARRNIFKIREYIGKINDEMLIDQTYSSCVLSAIMVGAARSLASFVNDLNSE